MEMIGANSSPNSENNNEYFSLKIILLGLIESRISKRDIFDVYCFTSFSVFDPLLLKNNKPDPAKGTILLY